MPNPKSNNCEGVDRIPLRIINDGAELLFKPMTRLLDLIYNMPWLLISKMQGAFPEMTKPI